MFKNIVVIVGCLAFNLCSDVNAGVRGESKLVSIQSQILNESRQLMIHMPNSYSLYKDTSYPVLYLLDGQRNFAHTVGTLDLLNQSGMAHEMIIVGVMNTDRSRDFTPTYDENYSEWGNSGGADNFLDFLERELKPFIKSNYRTNNYAILSGHSLGGLLSLYALQTRPEMFQAFFSFSPSLWWQKEVIFSEAEKFFSSKETLNKYVYINMGSEGGQMLSGFERYLALLNSNNREGFIFNTDLDTSEGHNTTALAGMSLALQKQVTSLRPSESVLEGGLPAIEKFYKDLSTQYGYQARPEYKAVNHSAYNALKRKEFDTAILLFTRNVENHSNKSDAYDSLADGFEAIGDLDKALEMRTKALEISHEENVENNAYKTRLHNLQRKIEQGKTE